MRWKQLRYASLLAVVGAANAAIGLLYPSALWWGEDQLQVVLTRGCSYVAKIFPDCVSRHEKPSKTWGFS